MIYEPKGVSWLKLFAVIEIERVAANVVIVVNDATFDFADAGSIHQPLGGKDAFANIGASNAKPAFR
jgi:hypothetical protein